MLSKQLQLWSKNDGKTSDNQPPCARFDTVAKTKGKHIGKILKLKLNHNSTGFYEKHTTN